MASKLYVMNCKKQNELFYCRVPGQRQLYAPEIPAGGQIEIMPGADIKILQGIVDHHKQYGMVAVADVDRTKEFINLCYQWDKPITQNQILYGAQHNDDVLTETGRQNRDNAAVAISARLEDAAVRNDSRVNRMELEIIEEKKPGDNSAGLSETIIVDHNNGAAPGSKRQKGRASARA